MAFIESMTCINTGNAWVRVRKGARRKGRDRDELDCTFGCCPVDLDGELSFQELSFGLLSFAQSWLLHACIDNLICSRRNLVGLVDGVTEAWAADRPTSHRCWPSRSAFQGWLCLDNTSQYRCWRWRPTELSEEEMFTAFVHCGVLELDPEREDRRSWSWRACTEAAVKCFLKAKFSRIYSTHGSWYTFQNVVDEDELEMWLEWLENHEVGIDSNWRSCWHRFRGGGLCAERAWHLSFSWSAVLCCRSTPAHGDHISTYL